MPTITDWLMVAITVVYVIATIAICWANIRSSRLTKEQIEETRKQFEENNRPHMTCQYILENRVLCGIRFYNYGNRPAYNVTFQINSDFIDIIKYKDTFSKLNSANYLFGINQHYDFFFSIVHDFNKQDKCPFIVTISYSYGGKNYTDEIIIHFEKQLPVQSTTTFEENLLRAIEKRNE